MRCDSGHFSEGWTTGFPGGRWIVLRTRAGAVGRSGAGLFPIQSLGLGGRKPNQGKSNRIKPFKSPSLSGGSCRSRFLRTRVSQGQSCLVVPNRVRYFLPPLCRMRGKLSVEPCRGSRWLPFLCLRQKSGLGNAPLGSQRLPLQDERFDFRISQEMTPPRGSGLTRESRVIVPNRV
jgi:hypothetical protein